MDNAIIDDLFSLVRAALTDTPLSEAYKSHLTPERIKQVYQFAKYHSIHHLVAQALHTNNIKTGDEQFDKACYKRVVAPVYQYGLSCDVLSKVSAFFEKHHIPFILLKGHVLRNFYPQPWMRTSCDIDILIHEEDLSRASAGFEEELSYMQSKKTICDICFLTPSKIHIELHHTLISESYAPFSINILQKVWDNVSLRDGCSYQYQMTDEFFYFYHIAHMAKHFQCGGCGIRPFIDLHILDKLVPHEEEARNALLEQGRLLTFANACRKIADIWFGNRSHDELTQTMQEYIFSGGVYGNSKNYTAMHQHRSGGKLRYSLSRIFFPYEKLKEKYPILEKYPFLTPFYEVKRWFRLFSRNKFKKTVTELKEIQAVTPEKDASLAFMLEQLDLPR